MGIDRRGRTELMTLERDIGALQARVEALEKRLDERLSLQDRAMASIDSKLTRLVSEAEQARGGLRVLFIVASVAGSLGAGIAWLVSFMHKP